MIQELCQDYPLVQLCRALEVSRSGYYRWRKSPVSARQSANLQLAQQVKAIYEAKKGAYGSPRVTQELRRAGEKCNHKRVERLMRQQGLRGRRGANAKSRPPTASTTFRLLRTCSGIGRRPKSAMKFGWPILPACPPPRAGFFWQR